MCISVVGDALAVREEGSCIESRCRQSILLCSLTNDFGKYDREQRPKSKTFGKNVNTSVIVPFVFGPNKMTRDLGG